jgi:fermentation-respiration switch protein FrsA (DUF1100 family)
VSSLWIGIGLLLSVPVSCALFLVWLYIFLCRNYLHYVVRIFQEKPIFIIPRGQPVPNAEDVTLTVDGLRLKGIYLKTPKPRKGVILFGLEFGSNRWACVPYCEQLIADGYDVFTIESRNQGDSDRQPGYDPLQWVTAYEERDMRAALDYLKRRPDADPRGVGFFGISKGAGAALIAFADEPYLRCFVTDGMFATYTTLVPYMRQWFRIYNSRYALQGLLPSWYYGMIGKHGLNIVSRQRGCSFPHLERALARRLHRPLLMIHGGGDTYIKPEMARALFDRLAGPKELWLVEGAKHNQAQQLALDEYRRRVLEFFNAHMATPPETDLPPNGTDPSAGPPRKSRIDSHIEPVMPTTPAAPANRDSATGIGEWGSGTQLPCS